MGKVLLCACKHIADSVTDLCFGLLEGEDFLPVIFHADDGPAFGVGFVEGFVDGFCKLPLLFKGIEPLMVRVSGKRRS